MLLFALVVVMLTGSFANAAGPAGCNAQSPSPTAYRSCHFVSKTGTIGFVAVGVQWSVVGVHPVWGTFQCSNGQIAVHAGLCGLPKGTTVYLTVAAGIVAARDVNL